MVLHLHPVSPVTTQVWALRNYDFTLTDEYNCALSVRVGRCCLWLMQSHLTTTWWPTGWLHSVSASTRQTSEFTDSIQSTSWWHSVAPTCSQSVSLIHATSTPCYTPSVASSRLTHISWPPRIHRRIIRRPWSTASRLEMGQNSVYVKYFFATSANIVCNRLAPWPMV